MDLNSETASGLVVLEELLNSRIRNLWPVVQ